MASLLAIHHKQHLLPVSRAVTDDYDFQAIIQYCPQPSGSSADYFRAKYCILQTTRLLQLPALWPYLSLEA
jgi:hypothetical protein